MRTHLLPCLVACCVIAIPWPAQAGAPDQDPPLSLQRAIALTLGHNPALQAADYAAQAADARIRQAERAPPLRAGVELENLAGTGATRRLEAVEATLSLTRVLEPGGKAKGRGELARREARLLNDEQDARRLDLLAETAQRFLQVVADQERLVVEQDATELARKTLEIVTQRARIGKIPTAEQQKAEIAFARAELDLLRAQHQLKGARHSLAVSWADTDATFSAAQADLLTLPPVPPFAALEAHLERNPDLLRFATAQRVGEARERLARAGRRPDIELAAGVRYLNAIDDTAFVLAASVPLGTGRRARSEIDEARALQRREPLAHAERRLALHATLYSLHQQLLQTRLEVESLRGRIIPAAELALRDYAHGYRAGRYSFLELADAQRVLLDARRELISTAADHHRFGIEIDRLTGGVAISGDTP
jgi:cobalt-zinc-cadmium efflux system outer membrane protein